MPASVIERAGDDLVITAFEHPRTRRRRAHPTNASRMRRRSESPSRHGTPRTNSGPGYAAARRAMTRYSPAPARRADPNARTRLRHRLDDARTRPGRPRHRLAVRRRAPPQPAIGHRSVARRIHLGRLAAGRHTRGAHPVATISAPVLDADGRIAAGPGDPSRAAHDDSRNPMAAASSLLREIDRDQTEASPQLVLEDLAGEVARQRIHDFEPFR